MSSCRCKPGWQKLIRLLDVDCFKIVKKMLDNQMFLFSQLHRYCSSMLLDNTSVLLQFRK